MSRPESQHVTSLRRFRERLVEARRAAADNPDLDAALARFTAVQTAIDHLAAALDDERDMTPLPQFDDPTAPEPKL